MMHTYGPGCIMQPKTGNGGKGKCNIQAAIYKLHSKLGSRIHLSKFVPISGLKVALHICHELVKTT